MVRSKKRRRESPGPAGRTPKRHGKGAASSPPPEPTRERSSRVGARGKSMLLRVLLVLLMMAMALAGVYLWRGRSPGPRESVRRGEAVGDGHGRMLDLLRQIRDRTPEDNVYLGDKGVREARARLEAVATRGQELGRWQALMELAREELNLGRETQAIAHYEKAYALAAQLGDRLSADQRRETGFRLGMAHMRWGESQNCSLRHNGESCILPLREGGIHTQQAGSRQAIRYFLEVLEETPRDSLLHPKTVWLTNIAYMTVGGYPHEVPPTYRIPEAYFRSTRDFPRFENIAPRLGLATFNLYGGAVVDDFTQDGHLDLFTTTFDTAGPSRFFQNNGDGTFSDRTEEAGLTGLYGGLNLVHADYDNDGDLDIFVLRGAWLSAAGRHPNSLLRNNGTGTVGRRRPQSDGQVTFTDVTFEAGLGQVHYPTQTAAWADYDNDGDVDLFIGNEHQAGIIDAPCQLFRNNGRGPDGRVTFTDVAQEAGVAHRAFVKGVVWGDYNHDRFPDLYVSALGEPNRLYRNNGVGSDGGVTFTDVAVETGTAGPRDSFPVWFWDFDNDGALDLYVSSYRGVVDAVGLVAASSFGLEVPLELPHLYRGDGSGGFQEVAQQQGLTRLHLPMGANFGDLDNDGYLDFYLGTGYPDYEALMPNVMYLNRGGQGFVDVTFAGGFGHLQKGHAVAFADIDHDGDQDVFEQMGGAYPGDKFSDALFENPGFDHRWITVKLVGRSSNRAAVGARIRVDVVEHGQRRSIYKQVSSGGSFGANPLRQTVGLGQASRIELLEVYWPTTDLRQKFQGVPMDRFLQVVEGEDEWQVMEGLGLR